MALIGLLVSVRENGGEPQEGCQRHDALLTLAQDFTILLGALRVLQLNVKRERPFALGSIRHADRKRMAPQRPQLGIEAVAIALGQLRLANVIAFGRQLAG